MGRGVTSVLSVVLLSGPALPSFALAQEQPAKRDDSAKQASKKELGEREKNALKGLKSPYREWLTEDVVFIITKEERSAFLQLASDVEREQFIEQFWLRRNPNPSLEGNAFKEEHYRRIAYANEHFAAGIPGWKTDRGRVFITWGPPDEIESHPNGGPHDRPPEQGGGCVDTYPWEKWRFRFLGGIGKDVELEFIDPSGSGDYHLTMDPSERDSVLYVPRGSLGAPRNQGCTPASKNEVEKIELFIGALRPPETKFKDLEAMVTARIVRDQVHFDYRIDFLRATRNTALVPITVDVPDRELSFHAKGGNQTAILHLFGRITTPSGRVVETFEEAISHDVPESQIPPSLNSSSIYQTTVPLRAGQYRLDIVVNDVGSGKVGVVYVTFSVPSYEGEKLGASTLILADEIEPAPAKKMRQGQFVMGSYEVHPRLNQEFTTAEKMGICLQIYGLKVDEKLHKASVSVVYRITRNQQEIWKEAESSDPLRVINEQLTLEKLIPLASLKAGRYKIEVEATDQLTHQTISRTADFTVMAAADSKTAANDSPGRF